ncbi:hypothetical protein CKO23_01225 [Thiocystis violacea]|nr:hypothetical protein [Thiocystis violacea]
MRYRPATEVVLSKVSCPWTASSKAAAAWVGQAHRHLGTVLGLGLALVSILAIVVGRTRRMLGAWPSAYLCSGWGSVADWPLGLGVAAGARIVVVADEVIPETGCDDHQTPATQGLMAGFVPMMVLAARIG